MATKRVPPHCGLRSGRGLSQGPNGTPVQRTHSQPEPGHHQRRVGRTARQQLFHTPGDCWRHKTRRDAPHGRLGAAHPVTAPLRPFNAPCEKQRAFCRTACADLDPHAVGQRTPPIARHNSQRKNRVLPRIEHCARGIGDGGQRRHGGPVPALCHHHTIAKNDKPPRCGPQVLAIPEDRATVRVVAALPAFTIERKHDVVPPVGKEAGRIHSAHQFAAMPGRRTRNPWQVAKIQVIGCQAEFAVVRCAEGSHGCPCAVHASTASIQAHENAPHPRTDPSRNTAANAA